MALIASLRKEFAEAEQLIAKAKKLDERCFLAALAELIITNSSDFTHFKNTFPSIAQQINEAMQLIEVDGR